jgi:molybdate/tungstate transport system substrate-binding protein
MTKRRWLDKSIPKRTTMKSQSRSHAAAAILLLVFAAIGGAHAAQQRRQKQTLPKPPVLVLYAGSLTTVMEEGIGPAFQQKTGFLYRGEGQGSMGAANMIRDRLRTPDIFISADPAVNDRILIGPTNHDMVRWYLAFASGELVLGYNPKSKFAPDFAAAAAGRKNWYDVLAMPGVKFGRTDPEIDPKGYRTFFLFSLAENFYHRPGMSAFLGHPQNPAQVFPEPELLARMEAGQVDAGIFYRHEVLAHGIPFITLPPELNQSDPALAPLYAQQSFTNSKGITIHGSPILFTITIPVHAPNPQGAERFVLFLLSSEGHDRLHSAGFNSVPVKAAGDLGQIPPAIRRLVQTEYPK